MVAFNFSPQFVEDVESGRKTQTIRQTSRAKAGDTIQLYTGQRTKGCRKLGDAVCIDSMYIGMTACGITLGDADRYPGTNDDFARADGFRDYAAMWGWFSERYETHSFTGYITRWHLTEHRDGLNGQARNPAGLPDSNGDLASAGGIAGVDITDHRRQVGTPHDGHPHLTQDHPTSPVVKDSLTTERDTEEKT
jgi:hypothetical protein